MEKVRAAAVKDEPVDRALIEKVFFRAFRRIREISPDCWNKDVIREYFINRHNTLIDIGLDDYSKAPETLKALCKVRKVKVIGKKDGALIVEYGHKRRPVNADFVPEAEIGDYVIVHYGYAVEKAV
ncbi:HypC/HybG/HupF family hydrogenase formation chaperone [Candidatus Woesearchaeota archaeon]|nr:HypC/HybG/HupF family hydrogenase formation chaperone [Candidatus Woesearchaeota archaeon]